MNKWLRLLAVFGIVAILGAQSGDPVIAPITGGAGITITGNPDGNYTVAATTTTKRVSIVQNALSGTAGAYPDSFDVHDSNNRWPIGVWAHPDNGAITCIYRILDPVPSDWDSTGTATFEIVWTSAATSGNVLWDVAYRAVGGNDIESLDQTGQTEAIADTTDAAPSAAYERLEASVAITESNIAAHDTLQIEVCRDGANASDTMADEALQLALILEYTVQ